MHAPHFATELRAICEHVAVYSGFPRALNALSAVDQVLADAGVAAPPALQRVQVADHETLVAERSGDGPAVLVVHALRP